MKREFVSHTERTIATDAAAFAGSSCSRAGNGVLLVENGGIVRAVRLTLDGELAWLSTPGHSSQWRRFHVRRGKLGHAEAVLRSPMTGRVVLVHVAAGDVVSKGQPLAIVEAMKMEHAIKAPRDAVVGRVLCSVGQLVDTGQELIELAPPE